MVNSGEATGADSKDSAPPSADGSASTLTVMGLARGKYIDTSSGAMSEAETADALAASCDIAGGVEARDDEAGGGASS